MNVFEHAMKTQSHSLDKCRAVVLVIVTVIFADIALLSEKMAFGQEQIRILLDSDAMNEIDDQHAIIRAFISPKIRVEGLTAAGFGSKKNSAQRSYDEEEKLLELMGLTGKIPLALGSSLGLKDIKTPDATDAAKLIIKQALVKSDQPLYVLAIGQATNLASALLLEPRIKDHVIFVLLGGSYHSDRTPAWGAADFNWRHDIVAVQAILKSDVPVIHLPAGGVTQNLVMSRGAMNQHLSNRGPACDYLMSLWQSPHMKERESWIMWDIAAIHLMADLAHGTRIEIPAPTVHADKTSSAATNSERTITVITDINPEEIFQSFWRDLDAATWLRDK